MSDTISALLEALKRNEGAGGMPGDDDKGSPIAAKVSVLHAKPLDGDPDADADSDEPGAEQNADDPQRNSAIVDVLQSDYPTIYAKISKTVDAEKPDDGSDSDSDMSGMSDGDMRSMLS